MTRILNLLEKRGYIERRSDTSDRRVYRIYITENGRKVQEELVPIATHHLHEVLDGIIDDDQQAVRALLERILQNIQKCGREFC